MRALILLLAVGFSVVLVTFVGCDGRHDNRLNGAGATFIKPIMEKWAVLYGDESGLEIDYQGIGSGGGVRQLIEGNIDFGCSDAPMGGEEVAKSAGRDKGAVLHVPLVLGAVAVIYNLPDVPDLKLDGAVLAEIYLGKVERWDHESIASLNPGVALPKMEIVPVYRNEGSGTTNIFTEFLAKSNDDYKSRIGANKERTSPSGVGEGQKGNDGVAGHVQRNAGTVGYVELTYAKSNRIPMASMRNKAGNFLKPNATSSVAAAEAAMKEERTAEPYTLHQFAFSLTDANGDDSYPICGLSYGLLYERQPAGKGEALVRFLKWCVTDGQQYATELDYAPLPEALSEKLLAALDGVTFEE